ncbi:hypothetical protein CKA32_003798 [Geitlerinema sp. FC II]|nr:hypothetical protein CKA32_003266 [Geitlerinema sp. FC II]PPT05954.1 hypothetical protein CKA32_003813 [Geitlerinema sp. FC II]PPT06700.1 hypothetical protein CKA32_005414 [Geitlerinema sp. FC II]PPT08297.1 hypothetical protein CKA32_003827 [Geitlerinema sp. FC II]PPT08429.1 hypothetical protein CKA32_003798 [Geitlerinema sp. FC II]
MSLSSHAVELFGKRELDRQTLTQSLHFGSRAVTGIHPQSQALISDELSGTDRFIKCLILLWQTFEFGFSN